MRQSDIIRSIEETAPLSIAAPWDKSGIQVASARAQISCLAVCLDPTPESVRRALEAGADMVLSHHPLCMEPRFTDRLDGYHEVLSLLFRADVPLYAAHTSLDANPVGPVAWLAEELKLRALTVLEATGSMELFGVDWTCGFGVVGELPEALSSEALREALLPWIAGSSPRLAGSLPERVRKVAICPGSGSSLAADAAAAGADVLITGDLKYHSALELPLPVLDVGHFSLEEEMMRRFSYHLKNILSEVTVVFVPAQDPLRPFSLTRSPYGIARGQ